MCECTCRNGDHDIFFLSRQSGSLEGAGKQRTYTLGTASLSQCCRTFFSITDNLILKSPLQADQTSLHWWCCSLCLEKADGGLKSSVDPQSNSLFPGRKAHWDVDAFGQSGCCAALLEVDTGADADRLYRHSLHICTFGLLHQETTEAWDETTFTVSAGRTCLDTLMFMFMLIIICGRRVCRNADPLGIAL